MSTDAATTPCTAFKGPFLLKSGSRAEVALAMKQAGELYTILAFDDATGRVIDFNVRGTDAEIVARYSAQTPLKTSQEDDAPSEPRGRGRPKLGVVAREVTLLPHHWDWLASQSGGASVVLRRLVEQERRTGGAKEQRRAAQEAAYKFMSAIAGDLPGFEEATRALFADNRTRFEEQIADWPVDIRNYAIRLAQIPEPTTA
jgi:hypothetical protein